MTPAQEIAQLKKHREVLRQRLTVWVDYAMEVEAYLERDIREKGRLLAVCRLLAKGG